MPATFKAIVQIFIDILGSAVPAVGALALLLFLWGGVLIIWSAGSEKAVSEGKGRLFWGVIVLFVMLSIWGLVAVLQNTFFYDELPPGCEPPAVDC